MSDTQCSHLHSLANRLETCAFVKNNSDCGVNQGFVNYVQLVYCDLGDDVIGACVALFLWLFVLFTGLAVATDDFFCPALGVISKSLRLSQNVAGVTFLAFGNGAADIFSAIAAIGNAKAGDAGLAIGALFGAGVFVTAVVAGLIVFFRPFTAMQRPLLRDVIFFLAAVYWAWFIMWDKQITQLEAAGFIILYVFYVTVVIVGRFINQRLKRKKQGSGDKPNEAGLKDAAHSMQYSASGSVCSQRDYGSMKYTTSDGFCTLADDINTKPETQSPMANTQDDDSLSQSQKSIIQNSLENGQSPNGDTQPLVDDDLNNKHGAGLAHDEDPGVEVEIQETLQKPQRPTGLWELFLYDVNPIKTDEWRDKKLYRKAYDCLKSPIFLLLKLTVPVVGEPDDGDELRKWNRLLNSLHLFISPTVAVFVTQVGFHTIGAHFPVWALVMAVCFGLALLVFSTSKTDKRPPYHTVFAFLGFAIAVVWIYTIANEIVNTLQALGVVFDLSDAILGLTFLAWGNSIGDLVADTSMARLGYPRMAISACFGGPLFNLLIGLGIPFTIACIERGGTFELEINVEEMVLACGLTMSLLFTLIVVPLSSFRMTRPYGIMLVFLYVIFLLVAILTEVDIIPNKKM